MAEPDPPPVHAARPASAYSAPRLAAMEARIDMLETKVAACIAAHPALVALQAQLADIAAHQGRQDAKEEAATALAHRFALQAKVVARRAALSQKRTQAFLKSLVPLLLGIISLAAGAVLTRISTAAATVVAVSAIALAGTFFAYIQIREVRGIALDDEDDGADEDEDDDDEDVGKAAVR